MLQSKSYTRGNMETVYSAEFKFENHRHVWNNIYMQKIIDIRLPKVREFDYKILHNIVASGYMLYKWKKIDDDKCQYCQNIETMKHMLYECPRILEIWEEISNVLKCNISWKLIVCGFPKYEINEKVSSINYIIGIICYNIFKQNSYCKFNNVNYKYLRLKKIILEDISFQSRLLQIVHPEVYNTTTFKRFIDTYA